MKNFKIFLIFSILLTAFFSSSPASAAVVFPAPNVTTPACINNGYSGSEITINWGAASPPIIWVYITPSSSSYNPNYYYDKDVTGTSTNGQGFLYWFDHFATLYYNPGINYAVITTNGTDESSPKTFSIPACPTATPTPTPSPSPSPSPSPTPTPTPSPTPTPTPAATAPPLPPTQCPMQTANARVQNGLISAQSVGTNFGNDKGQCISSKQAAFAPFKMPVFNDLKTIYYTRSKATKLTLTSPIASSTDLGAVNTVYYVSGDLTVNGNPTGTNTQVIFVEGNLNFSSAGNYCYGSACPAGAVSGTVGTMFVVKGDINIDPAVTRIDAVLISFGSIYTAGAGCVKNDVPEISPGVDIQQLVVNGSLISLNPAKPIIFCRNLKDNNAPAEFINSQPKYLVLLRDLYSDTIQKWMEVE